MSQPRVADPASDLESCHREPIQAPGSIQPCGVLIAADAASLRITHVSANFARSTRIASHEALGKPLAELVGAEAAAAIARTLVSERYSPSNVLRLDLPLKREQRRDVVVHAHAGSVFVELTPASPPEDHVHVVSQVQAIIATLRRTTSVVELCDRTAEALRALTGYDRVMVYRFDSEGHGEVVAESRVEELEPYLNMRYPASDIPRQARSMYLKQRVRVIGDVGYQPVPILADFRCQDRPPLDMTYCAIRSVSPMHLEYLANMGVGATLAISLIQDDTLWGMLVCHHRTPRAVTSDVRAMSDLIGQLVMLLIAQASEREGMERLVQRQAGLARLKRGIDQAETITTGLLSEGSALVDLVDATGAVIRFNGRVNVVGDTPSADQCDAILNELCATAAEDVVATDALGKRHPAQARFAAIASGVLFLPILNNPGDAIAWFRPEVARMVSWGGNPHKAAQVDANSGVVSPRKSFAAWRELLEGTSAAWTQADIQSAQNLRRLITGGMLHHAEAQLAHLSMIDSLTGLPNRRCLEQALGKWSARVPSTTPQGATPQGATAALIFLDLDRFKTINDSLGHAAGDELLMQVASRFRAAVPESCIIARLGGDEFVVFAEDEPALAISKIATDMLATFEDPFLVGGRPHRTTASVGVALALQPGADLLREADVAMYAAKREGGGRSVRYEAAQHEAVVKTMRIEQDMFLALRRQEFVLHYQPIIDLASGTTRGFEALVRWHHPTSGWILPGDFIPLAEDTGFILELGAWIMDAGMRELAGWGDPSLSLSINVAPRQLTSDRLLHSVQVFQAKARCRQRLTIEVTEGALMDAAAVRRLHRLRAAGCLIAVDDFGTGYSSLAYLRQLPVDIIKIDRSFVAPVEDDPQAERFLAAIVALAKTCNLSVVAEGIETEKQLRIVKAAGCDSGQGYLFSKPMPAEAARAWQAVAR